MASSAVSIIAAWASAISSVGVRPVNIAGVIDADINFKFVDQPQKCGNIVDFMDVGAQAYLAAQ